jgi:DNA-directed RNA polymerase specialized sigma24 family protein
MSSAKAFDPDDEARVRAPESIDKLHDLLDDAVEHARRDRRLVALRRLREELSFVERQVVRDAHASGLTWGQIARLVGVSRQAIHQRYRNVRDIEPETELQRWERRLREMNELAEQLMSTPPRAIDP